MTELDKIPVLLVDDRPENLTALEGLLEDMGLEIFKASSGNEALRLTLRQDFAIVLMDVRMPEMDGFETAELLRANQKTSRLPIIFVTAAMKDTAHQFKGYEAGAFDYLLKPVEPTVLRSKMRVFCDLYRQRRSIEMREQRLETLVSERTAELNKTLDSLRESEMRYRDLLASVTSYMYTVVMDQGRAVSTTHGPGCLAVTGYSAGDFAADPGLWYRMICEEDRQAVLDAARQVLASKYSSTFEHRIQHKDGSIRWVEATLVPHVGPEGNVLTYDGVIIDITERKRAEMEREQYYNFFQSSTDLMCIADPEGAFLKTNPAFSQVLGYSAEELTAKPFIDFVHPDDRQATMDEMARQRQTGSSFNFENRYMCSDGSVRWLSWRATFNKEEGITYATARDFTERKEMEEFIRNILECVDEGFVIIDRDFRILSANSAYARMVDLPIEMTIGRPCYEVSHHSSAPCFRGGHPCAVQKTFETGRTEEGSHLHQDGDGGSVHIETKAYPLTRDGSGEVLTVIETLVDCTDRLKLEDQLRQAQKMESIGTLAGGIAHDFNNILTAVIGYGNITLMKMAKDDPNRPNIEQILEASDRAAHLTRDLLLFSRKQPIDRKPVGLNEVIRKLGRFLIRVIGEDIAFSTSLSEGPIPVLADENQIGQVLMNLAANARDAMPKGGTFTITTEMVQLDDASTAQRGLEMPGMFALISVSDSGLGMDEPTKQRIFEPFFTTKEVGKGTGLGLAVVYGIIKQHEGHIAVYSEPGQGTTFRIYLPVIGPGVVQEKAAVAEGRPAGGTETILLAEDDEAVRNLTVSILREFGYNVITAVDGDDAVIKYRENRDHIHLLLLDLIMPNKSGKDAYDEIIQMRPDIRSIFMSGYSRDVVRNKASLGNGATIVSKPIYPLDLLKKVRAVLDGGAPQA